MMSPKPKLKFDEIGYWSEIKLDIIKDYASAYSKILAAQKKPKLYHIYIDAFAGAGARPIERSWVIDIQKQCQDGNIPFFFKQWGGLNRKKAGRKLEGEEWLEMPA